MLTIPHRLRFLLAAVALLLGLAAPAVAQVTYPPRIGASDYIGDFADLITPADEEKVKAAAAKLLTDQGIPLVVVTINSMADYGARNWPIERYAMNLFAEWGIGSTDRNAGVLLLVSKNDRKVRIEMGAAFTHARDVFAADVINRVIVPKFKAGQFSQGIVLGSEAIAHGIGQPTGKMQAGGMTGRTAPSAAPTGSSPARTVGAGGLVKTLSGSLACFIIPIILIVAFMAVRSFKRGPGHDAGYGAGGYGPVGWGGSRGSGMDGMLGGLALGGLLGHAWGSRNRSDGGGFSGGSSDSSTSSSGGFGGFSGGSFGGFGGGGSFGGGVSGGGGATGSW